MRSDHLWIKSLVAAAVFALGCDSTPFRCSLDNARSCLAGSRCTLDGYCAAPSAGCESGFAYASSSATPGVCVPRAQLGVDASTDVAAVDATRDTGDPDAQTVDALALDGGFDAQPLDAPADDRNVLDALDVAPVDVAPDAPPTDMGFDAGPAPPAVLASLPESTACAGVRQILPLSTERVSRSNPIVQLLTAGAAEPTTVEFARSRDFSGLVQRFVYAPTTGMQSAQLPFSLDPGVWFWRAARVCGSSAAPTRSALTPVWSMVVPARGPSTGLLTTRYPGAADFNGDGRAEFVVGDPGVPAVYIYTARPSDDGGLAELRLELTLRPPSPDLSPGFGAAVDAGDIDGDGLSDLIVGACTRNGEEQLLGGTNRTSCARSVLIYRGNTTGLLANPSLPSFIVSPSSVPNVTWSMQHRFGSSVTAVGDFDRDGYGDLVVGAHTASAFNPVVLFRGSPSGPLSSTASFNAGLTNRDTNFGISISAIGDFNSDGFEDFAVGAPGSSQGSVYIALGVSAPPATLSNRVQRYLMSNNAFFGAVVGLAGDLNGDHYADLAVAAPGTNRLYIVAGENGPNAMASFDRLSASFTTTTHTISSVAGGFDMNGDGFSDLVVGLGASTATNANGQAWVLRGSSQPSGTVPIALGTPLALPVPAPPYPNFARFGLAVASADANADGLADVIVAGPAVTRTDGALSTANVGPLTVFHGSSVFAGTTSTGIFNTASVPRPLVDALSSAFGRALH
ncbi:MAG: FG-GAP repeat protein [Myxococcales bacterium]|nr:FG-GAP repeat protein [Myxococcales bacterium]